MSAKPLQGRAYVVTGAGKGLGRAYAMQLAGLGAGIVVNNRTHPDTPSSAAATVEAIERLGGKAVYEHSDVTDPECGARMLALALETFGGLDGIIANAGVSEGRSFHKQTPEEFVAVLEPNLYGTVNVIQPAFRHFYENGAGTILVSTSGAGLYGEHGLPAYSTAKAALLGLMYSLHLEGAGRSVRVNAIAPYAATQMTRDHLPEALVGQVSVDKVAPAACWLMTPECQTSGEIFVVGAGRISRAAMRESASVELQLDELDLPVAKCLEGLQSLEQTRRYAGARQHFAAFVKSDKDAR